MILTLVTPPVPSINVIEAKENLRVLHDDEDLVIQRLIDAAHRRVQQETGNLYGAQEWEAIGVVQRQYVPDLRPVTSLVSALDGAGEAIPGAALDGGVFTAPEWPAGLVAIRFTAGQDMPEDLRHAMHLLVAHWYENRSATADAIKELPFGVTDLMALHRRMYC